MSLNIGGSEDAFFRYKMPDIEVKIEGRGNGIKTVLPNIADIGQAIHRNPEYPTKYFATELGALSKWDSERNVGIVNGAHSKDQLKKLLNDFITRYVLCPQCNLPETDLKVKDKKIFAKCLACGFRGLSDNKHKLATYIINHPPAKKGKGDKGDKEEKPEKTRKEKRKEKSKAADTEEKEDVVEEKPAEETNGKSSKKGKEKEEDDDEEEGAINFEVTEEMRNMVMDKTAELDDPVELVAKILKSVKGESVKVKMAKLKEHQEEQDYEDETMFKYAFKALITKSMAKQLKEHLDLLTELRASDDRDSQWQFLTLMEERCESYPDNLKDVPACLMMMYEADLVEEEVVLTWHEKGVSALIALADTNASKACRDAADKFVEWLENAEEESDEEDEDDE